MPTIDVSIRPGMGGMRARIGKPGPSEMLGGRVALPGGSIIRPDGIAVPCPADLDNAIWDQIPPDIVRNDTEGMLIIPTDRILSCVDKVGRHLGLRRL